MDDAEFLRELVGVTTFRERPAVTILLRDMVHRLFLPQKMKNGMQTNEDGKTH